MSFLKFGGFVASLLGSNNSSTKQPVKHKSYQRRYESVRTQFDSMNNTVERIGSYIDQIKVHEKRINKLEKIVNRIERIQAYMQTYEFKQLNIDYPGTKEELLDEIEDLRYEAKVLFNQRALA